MELTEEFFNTPHTLFELPEHGDLWVFRRCPKCGRFIETGIVQYNGMGDIRPKGWLCGRDGEVDPYWEWVI